MAAVWVGTLYTHTVVMVLLIILTVAI